MTSPPLLQYFKPAIALPGRIPSPFNSRPHPLAVQACTLLQSRLQQLSPSLHNFDGAAGGKMMGALVVRTTEGETAYLAAFSGMLGGRWQLPGFAPPVFNECERAQFLPAGEKRLQELSDRQRELQQSDSYKCAVAEQRQIEREASEAMRVLKQSHCQRKQQRDVQRALATAPAKGQGDIYGDSGLIGQAGTNNKTAVQMLEEQSRADKREAKQQRQYWKHRIAVAQAPVDHAQANIDKLKQQRQLLSRQLQKQVFDGYRLLNISAQERALTDFFPAAMPPGGSGDCVAIKLLQACFKQRLTPVCLAEFWWGSPPAGGVRHHGRYYPACRGKCRPVLPFMLGGLTVDMADHEQLIKFTELEPRCMYEDDHLLVVLKPAGMLSVPGKIATDSVELRLRKRYPTVQSSMLVHRLDQATSGLLLAAKSDAVRTQLQRLFQQRQIEKQYAAVLAGTDIPDEGVIDLPLRTDLDDRPRQRVCLEHGKQSLTHYKVVERCLNTTRIAFYPVTGRTHQLRIHAAHTDGLNAPIVGDELYGVSEDLYGSGSNRLHLHAQQIGFTHPVSGQQLLFESPPPF